MKITRLRLGITVAGLILVMTPGCQTPGPGGSTNNTTTGALLGSGIGAIAGAIIGNRTGNAGIGALIGAGVGGLFGASIGSQIDEQQRQWLRANAPGTLEKVEHNDTVPTQKTPSQAATSAATPAPAPDALSVDDVKALAHAGVKDEVVEAEITKSSSKFSTDDVNNLRQANVNEPILDYIQKNATS